MKPPNPGSGTALKQGCTCAVMDNNHGKYPPWPPDGWWITEGCPVHAPIRTTSTLPKGATSAEPPAR